MTNIGLLIPEIVLAFLGLAILVADMIIPSRHGRSLHYLSLVSLGVTFAVLGALVAGGAQGIGTLWVLDPFSIFLKFVLLSATFLTLMLTFDYPGIPKRRTGAFCALLLWSTVGMMLLVSSVDFLLIFLSLELISIASFILTGFETGSLKSSEGAIKYFLVGAFSSALTVYGISLFYGATGTTNLLSSMPSREGLYVLALLLILVGLGFKVAMVPFHFWVPDAYEGAPTPITAFLSVAPKVATIGVVLRVFTERIPHAAMDITLLLALLAAFTMTVGNLTAIFQDNIKRLLAYSSVAQAGYILIGLVAGDAFGREAVLLYCLVYLFMNLGAFAVAIVVGNQERSYEIEAFEGLSRRNLGLSLLMAFFLLSLAGIPPLAGFVAKFYVFASAIKVKLYWLAVVGVLNSVVSIYYYMRVVRRMFFMPARSQTPVPVSFWLGGCLALTAVAIFLFGIYPHPVVEAARLSARFLP